MPRYQSSNMMCLSKYRLSPWSNGPTCIKNGQSLLVQVDASVYRPYTMIISGGLPVIDTCEKKDVNCSCQRLVGIWPIKESVCQAVMKDLEGYLNHASISNIRGVEDNRSKVTIDTGKKRIPVVTGIDSSKAISNCFATLIK
jgi:hypothetical protein